MLVDVGGRPGRGLGPPSAGDSGVSSRPSASATYVVLPRSEAGGGVATTIGHAASPVVLEASAAPGFDNDNEDSVGRQTSRLLLLGAEGSREGAAATHGAPAKPCKPGKADDPGKANKPPKPVLSKEEQAAADERSRLAQAAECGMVGIHHATEAVQSEVACCKMWRDSEHDLFLHKDCICEMIKHNVSSVILIERTFLCRFPECVDGETPVAMRIPKDDTKEKDKDKEKKEKVLKYPKYSFFRARTSAGWDIEAGTALVIEGIYLGWTLSGSREMPCGCELADDGFGLPEPIEMLSATDIAEAEGAPGHPEFLRVSIKLRRSASWKIGNFIIRLLVEFFSVHVFMSFLGSRPNTYTAKWAKPWDTYSDNAFVLPGVFQLPQVWRGPGMERIWWLYLITFWVFLFLRLVIAALWAVIPNRGKLMKYIAHLLAAVYPLTVTLPFVLYLVYFTGVVVNCRSCAVWHCGAYAHNNQTLGLDGEAFKASGGCNIASVHQLHEYRKFVRTGSQHFHSNAHCDFNRNRILDALGISLDTSQNEGSCQPWQDTQRARDEVILDNLDQVCGQNFTGHLRLEHYMVTEHDRDRLPWSMFGRHLPVNNEGTCSNDGKGFENGAYVYYEPQASSGMENAVSMGGICICRSATGVRDCFRRLEGTVDRCTHFTGVPMRYGSLLQFPGIPSLTGRFMSLFHGLSIPIFALFTMKAWDDVPFAGVDKFDQRMQSRMKLDILDFFMFYHQSALHSDEESLPLLKFIIPDMTWHDFELYVWCFAWGSAFVWWSLSVFVHIFDFDPDKTPKMWKSATDIFEVAQESAASLSEGSRVADPYDTALRKQRVLYEKELQKVIKKRMVVEVLDEEVDIDDASFRDWQRCIIVFSSPKVKDLQDMDFQDQEGVFTLYVARSWPWSTRPRPNVWKSESWEEYTANEPADLEPTELLRGLEKITIDYDEVLLRVRPSSMYYWFDVRYLGWCDLCGLQPRSEFKKMKEDDFRITPSNRIPGHSETYYNKYRFDFFERNLEFVGAMRSLAVDLLFLAARVAKGFWRGGFSGTFAILLVLKNMVFSIFGLMYLFTCGNTRHSHGPCGASPLELIAKCIERTKIGNAIKLSMLMPLRICIECTSCGFRMSAEERQSYLRQRMHILALRRVKTGHSDSELDHEIRLCAGQIEDYQDLIEMLETKNIVKMRMKIRAKDIIA